MITLIPDVILYAVLLFLQYKGLCDTRGFWLLLILGALVHKYTSEAAYHDKANSFALQGAVNAFVFRMACWLWADCGLLEEGVRTAVIIVAMVSIVVIHKHFSSVFYQQMEDIMHDLYYNTKDNDLHRRKKEILKDLINLSDYENFVTYSTHLDKLMTNRPTTSMSFFDKVKERIRKTYFESIGGEEDFTSFRAYKYIKRNSFAHILNGLYFIEKENNMPVIFHENQFNLPASKWEALRLAAFRWLMELADIAGGVEILVK